MNDSKPIKLSKKTINIIRTTGRNNVELINIADNKANILMSLNAIMITILVPMILTHLHTIERNHLYLPIIILGLTSITTVIVCAIVLRPADINKTKTINNKSPFFFGNYHKMKNSEYLPFVERSLRQKDQISDYILQDHYLVGRILGAKYQLIRRAFEIFVIGIGLTIISTLIMILIY